MPVTTSQTPGASLLKGNFVFFLFNKAYFAFCSMAGCLRTTRVTMNAVIKKNYFDTIRHSQVNVIFGSLIYSVGTGGPVPTARDQQLAGLAPPQLLPELRRRKSKGRGTNLRILRMTWALIFLTKLLCLTCSIKV